MTSSRSGQHCIFCRIADGRQPAAVVYQDPLYVAFLDAHPRTRGHLQLIPRQHYRWIHQLPDMGEIFSLAQRIIRVIIPVLGADHVTLSTFGHEVHHAHIWIVPQYASAVRFNENGAPGGKRGYQSVVAKMIRQALLKEV